MIRRTFHETILLIPCPPFNIWRHGWRHLAFSPILPPNHRYKLFNVVSLQKWKWLKLLKIIRENFYKNIYFISYPMFDYMMSFMTSFCCKTAKWGHPWRHMLKTRHGTRNITFAECFSGHVEQLQSSSSFWKKHF